MTNWQKNRNYRRIRLADGSVKNIIIVDGQKVEVTDEVYKAYSQMDRGERYQEEQRKTLPQVSLEKLCAASVPIDLYIAEHSPSAEDEVMAAFDARERDRLISLLPQILDKLPETEREMIQAIYFDGISAREYARRHGVYPRAVMYRLEKLQEKLRQKIFI